MVERVDFSRQASVFDLRHGALLSASAVQKLAAVANLGSSTTVLDVGCGTGRIAIPLTRIGCRVTAVDCALPMIDALQKKSHDGLVRIAGADGASLPFAAAAFDAVVIARLLYLIPDWREVLIEVIRVLKGGGRLLHEWGNGTSDEPWVQIRDKARKLFEDAGVMNPFHPGVRVESEVDTFLHARGLTTHTVVDVPADVSMMLADFLDRIVTGECSYTWKVPEEVQRECLPELRKWAKDRFDLQQPAFARALTWRIYQKSARSIRQATEPDAEQIADAHRNSILTAGSRFYPPEVVEAWGSQISPSMYVRAMATDETFFIAVEEPLVLGFSSHHVVDGQHRIAVYVRGSNARQGLGTALYRMAEETARRAGAATIHVDASLAAVEFYTRNGFLEIARGEHRLASGEQMACVLMCKTLANTSP